MATHHHEKSITVHRTSVLLVLKLTIVTVLFDASFLAVAFISDSVQSLNNTVPWWNIIAYDTLYYIILMLLQAVAYALLMALWYRETFTAQEGFLIHRRGLILINEERLKISTAESVTYTQTLFGKLFHYGTIALKYPNQDELYLISGIPQPEFFIHLLEEDKIKNP